MVHLYHTSTNSKQIEETIEALDNCTKIDISNISNLDNDDVYLVEIDNADKNILLQIKKLLIDKKQSLIYFYITDSQNLMLFQLASLLNVSSIFTHKQTTDKIVETIKKEILEKKAIKLDIQRAKILMQEYSFMIFDNKELVFASQKLYDDFECKDLEMLSANVCSLCDIEALLKDDIVIENNFLKAKSKTSTFSGEKFIYIEKDGSKIEKHSHEIDFIQNRIYFIEMLKEKVLENTMSSKELGIITIEIENVSKLREEWSEYEIEMSVRDLLFKVALEIDSDSLVAQYDDDLYVILCNKSNFKELEEKAHLIQKKTIAYSNTQMIKPTIGLYVLDIKDIELNTALKIIAKISTQEIDSKDIKKHKIHRISNVGNGLGDARAIDILLLTTFTNKEEINLLNIYKGLCINTPSLIFNKTDQEVYVTFKQLQGTAMYFEKETLLQSGNFPKDIVADVKHIDFTKKIAQLNNFRFICGNANLRKYSRVTCAQRTPISITHDKGTMNGEIIDISMNSIAIKTRIYKDMNMLKLSKIVVNYTLPSKSHEDGYVKLSLGAKVISTIYDKDFSKIIINIYEDKDSETHMMDYIYDRQKEIIIELKKHSTLVSAI